MIDDLFGPGADARSEEAERRRRRSGLKRVLVGLLVLVGIVVGGVVGAGLYLQHQVTQGIDWLGDPFEALATRPPQRAEDAQSRPLNILLLGSDSRISAGDPSLWEQGAQRTDTIMLVHIPADRSAVYGISIPRDSWVEIPGHGEAKINAAFSLGGPSLLIETVENLTGVYIDHIAVTDFESFARLTDAVGGVTITIPETTYDRRREETIPAGRYEMDGAEALDYVRQRYGLPAGDLDRVQRQQNWMRQVARSMLRTEVLANPFTLVEVIRTVSRSLAVDDSFTVARMRTLALSLGGLRRDDLRFLTAPVEGLGTSEDGQSIVVLDDDGVAALGEAVRQDRIAEYLAQDPENVEVLGGRVD